MQSLVVLVSGAMLVGGVLAAAPSETAAAVRYCRAPIATEGEHAKSEAAARRLALDRWAAEARRLGEAYASWRLATPRDIACQGRAGGGHVCRAVASPCAIAQNPDRLPAGGVEADRR
jgi:hypothetical protein